MNIHDYPSFTLAQHQMKFAVSPQLFCIPTNFPNWITKIQTSKIGKLCYQKNLRRRVWYSTILYQNFELSVLVLGKYFSSQSINNTFKIGWFFLKNISLSTRYIEWGLTIACASESFKITTDYSQLITWHQFGFNFDAFDLYYGKFYGILRSTPSLQQTGIMLPNGFVGIPCSKSEIKV